MSPADLDELPDVMWQALVGRMQREAEAVRAMNAKLAKTKR